MNQLQAAMRDKAAKSWRERTTMYKVGSPMKGCHHCGEVVEDEETGRRRYVSGFQVFRSYKPKETGWTWKCEECGAKDLACWENDEMGFVEEDLGTEPIVGARDAVMAHRKERRKLAMASRPKPEKFQDPRVKELMDEIARLETYLKGAKW